MSNSDLNKLINKIVTDKDEEIEQLERELNEANEELAHYKNCYRLAENCGKRQEQYAQNATKVAMGYRKDVIKLKTLIKQMLEAIKENCDEMCIDYDAEDYDKQHCESCCECSVRAAVVAARKELGE